MNKYILTSDKFLGEIIFEFDADDRLCHFSNRAQLDDVQWEYVMRRMPAHSSWVKENFTSDYTTIMHAKADLSFENFWNSYGYKINGRTTCERLWKGLTEAEKIRALSYIHQYKAQVAQAGTALKYPETYLRTKCWNN